MLGKKPPQSETIENKSRSSLPNIFTNLLDSQEHMGIQCTPMAKQHKPDKIQLRVTDEDYAIILAGMRKHGLDRSQILRMALRRFAEAEGLKLKTA